jgi:hypothetical protein
MRHPYAINSEERTQITFFLAVLAIFLSLGLAGLFRQMNWTPPLWIDVSSVPVLFGLLYSFFSRVAWKWGWLRRAVWILSTPVLLGSWSGTVQSNYDGTVGQSHDIEVIIGQDWTHITVRLIARNSKSHSVSASIDVTEDECVLIYDYLNEPNMGAVTTMHMHRGTARLVLVAADRLEGDYYTGRDRENIGAIRLRRA